MYKDWTKCDVEVLKTKARITFLTDEYEKGGRLIQDSRTTEYGLTPNFSMEDVVIDQQRKLLRDLKSFFGSNDELDELREILV
jgi:hypothetical protein